MMFVILGTALLTGIAGGIGKSIGSHAGELLKNYLVNKTKTTLSKWRD
ncbi:hypothetical protein [Streptococcus pneumoniae]